MFDLTGPLLWATGITNAVALKLQDISSTLTALDHPTLPAHLRLAGAGFLALSIDSTESTYRLTPA